MKGKRLCFARSQPGRRSLPQLLRRFSLDEHGLSQAIPIATLNMAEAAKGKIVVMVTLGEGKGSVQGTRGISGLRRPMAEA